MLRVLKKGGNERCVHFSSFANSMPTKTTICHPSPFLTKAFQLHHTSSLYCTMQNVSRSKSLTMYKDKKAIAMCNRPFFSSNNNNVTQYFTKRDYHFLKTKQKNEINIRNNLNLGMSLSTLPFTPRQLICKSISSSTCYNNNSNADRGIFGIPNLHKITDWKKITDEVIDDCNNTRKRIYSKINNPDLSILDELDYISYTICEIADAAELCRCVHVDFEHRRAAEETVFRFGDYMLSLGHDKNMYNVLCALMDNAEIVDTMSDEQLVMANDMKNEFERDGVHLSETVRERLRNLNNDITTLESDFQKMAQQFGGSFAVPSDTIKVLPNEIYSQATNEKLLRGYGLKRGTAILHSNWVDMVTRLVANPVVRESFYKFAKSLGDENVRVLEKIIVKKNEKAQLLGFRSYGDLIAKDQMLGSREKIKEFLEGILENTKSKMQEELNIMKVYKKTIEKNTDVSTSAGTTESNNNEKVIIYPWDIPFYSTLATRERFQSDFNGYFKLENVLKGLEIVCLRLFNLKIKFEQVSDAEDWTNKTLNKNNHVRKLILYDADADESNCCEHVVGNIYLDLYPRPNKVGGATHFALRHSHRKFCHHGRNKGIDHVGGPNIRHTRVKY